MQFKNIAVIGAGVMGRGIAQVCAQNGLPVFLYDISQKAVQDAVAHIEKKMGKAVEKNKIESSEKDGIVNRIKTFSDLAAAVRSADLVIETVAENLAVKTEVFQKLDSMAPSHAVLASNTSALPITSMAAVTERPAQVLGLHFMNPVPVMKGVEVIPGMETSGKVLQSGLEFVKFLGKEPVEAVDYAGFIATRILDAMLNEAVYCVMDGNDPREVDKAMKICTNFPMGPCELIDMAGADILYHGLSTLENEFGQRFHAAPLLRKMVRAGRVGRKAGKGFYDYEKG